MGVILSGCATTSQKAQTAAGERLGTQAAGVTLERQPDECGEIFGRLDYGVGDEALTVIKRYEAYIAGPINGRIVRCYRFNEWQRQGLEARQ